MSLNMHRIIKYTRHEYQSSEEREARLLYFIYDILYFGGCGILPPLHIINQIFRSGGSEGGMSPGATWQSFEISENEYKTLVHDVLNTDMEDIAPYARYSDVKFKIDTSFDHIQNHLDWMSESCAKHRDSWHNSMREKKKKL